MVIVSHLRPGNWIHRKGSSAYGIVNGKLLALLEEDEKERERFEGIGLTGELLEAAGAKMVAEFDDIYRLGNFDFVKFRDYWEWCVDDRGDNEGSRMRVVQYVHQLQNIYFLISGSELPLPESAKIINQAVEK